MSGDCRAPQIHAVESRSSGEEEQDRYERGELGADDPADRLGGGWTIHFRSASAFNFDLMSGDCRAPQIHAVESRSSGELLVGRMRKPLEEEVEEMRWEEEEQDRYERGELGADDPADRLGGHTEQSQAKLQSRSKRPTHAGTTAQADGIPHSLTLKAGLCALEAAQHEGLTLR
jgi:hypothetical protein